MSPSAFFVICVSAIAILCFGLGYRLRDLVIAQAYENHLNEHAASGVVPGCIFCGVERPQIARDVVTRIEYGPKTVHELEALALDDGKNDGSGFFFERI